MGMIDSNVQLLATARRAINPHEVIDVDEAQTFASRISYPGKRDAGSSPENSMCEAHVVQMGGAVASHIRALEAELMHYRLMLEDMVQQRTERLSRRISILECCNSSLGENYHKMHRMYLELMLKGQAHEESGIEQICLP